jgi:HAD superfamily hydrolase (TIGR01509 family)
MPKIKGVLFDLDGTLIDTLEAYTRAFNQGIKKFDLEPISEEKLASFLNRALGLESILRELFPSHFEKPEIRLQCLTEIAKAYRTEVEQRKVSLKPGTREVLSKLKEMGLKIGIVTGRTTSGELKWAELHWLNIAHFIDSIVTGADAPRKPSPDGAVKCANEIGLSPEECVLVGDSQADIITGKAAGIITIAIPTGVAKEELLSQEGPTAIISSLAELPSLIRNLNQEQGELKKL